MQNVLKLSFGMITGGKGHSKYFYDLCLSIFDSVGRLKKIKYLATKLFHACDAIGST